MRSQRKLGLSLHLQNLRAQALHVLTNTCDYLVSPSPSGWEVASHDFDVHFSNGSSHSASFHVLIGSS